MTREEFTASDDSSSTETPPRYSKEATESDTTTAKKAPRHRAYPNRTNKAELNYNLQRQLALDIESAGGLVAFKKSNGRALAKLCNKDKPEVYKDHYGQIRHEVRRWGEIPIEEYHKLLGSFGVVPAETVPSELKSVSRPFTAPTAATMASNNSVRRNYSTMRLTEEDLLFPERGINGIKVRTTDVDGLKPGYVYSGFMIDHDHFDIRDHRNTQDEPLTCQIIAPNKLLVKEKAWSYSELHDKDEIDLAAAAFNLPNISDAYDAARNLYLDDNGREDPERKWKYTEIIFPTGVQLAVNVMRSDADDMLKAILLPVDFDMEDMVPPKMEPMFVDDQLVDVYTRTRYLLPRMVFLVARIDIQPRIRGSKTIKPTSFTSAALDGLHEMLSGLHVNSGGPAASSGARHSPQPVRPSPVHSTSTYAATGRSHHSSHTARPSPAHSTSTYAPAGGVHHPSHTARPSPVHSTGTFTTPTQVMHSPPKVANFKARMGLPALYAARTGTPPAQATGGFNQQTPNKSSKTQDQIQPLILDFQDGTKPILVDVDGFPTGFVVVNRIFDSNGNPMHAAFENQPVVDAQGNPFGFASRDVMFDLNGHPTNFAEHVQPNQPSHATEHQPANQNQDQVQPLILGFQDGTKPIIVDVHGIPTGFVVVNRMFDKNGNPMHAAFENQPVVDVHGNQFGFANRDVLFDVMGHPTNFAEHVNLNPQNHATGHQPAAHANQLIVINESSKEPPDANRATDETSTTSDDYFNAYIDEVSRDMISHLEQVPMEAEAAPITGAKRNFAESKEASQEQGMEKWSLVKMQKKHTK